MRADAGDAGPSADRVAAAFDGLAASWDDDHGPRSARRLGFACRAALLAALLRHRPPPRRALDIGCGTGQYLLALAGLLDRGVGIDISPAMIERARRNARAASRAGRLAFATCRVEDLLAAGERPFDLVFFLGSLEHVAEPRRALMSGAQLLREGGLLAVAMPHPWHPGNLLARWRTPAAAMPPLQPLASETVRAWAEGAGLVRLTRDQRRGCSTLPAGAALLLAGSRFLLYRRPLRPAGPPALPR